MQTTVEEILILVGKKALQIEQLETQVRVLSLQLEQSAASLEQAKANIDAAGFAKENDRLVEEEKRRLEKLAAEIREMREYRNGIKEAALGKDAQPSSGAG